MSSDAPLILYNGQATERDAVPIFPIDIFREIIIRKIQDGLRIASLLAMPSSGRIAPTCLLAILSDDRNGSLLILSTEVADSYPAITPECPQAHLFEREIYETHAIRPEGHPWLKPVRFLSSETGSTGVKQTIGKIDFFTVDGSEVHEVAVGPVHAGIIEPGHFRFQCHGENVLHLEISLGYQHRGIERAIRTAPIKRLIHYMETLAGDTTIGHATAYCQIMESLCDCTISGRAQALRGIALELERLANHVGDLGALAGDVGYLPAASYCGRIRGDFLNMTATLCGSRFGRGLIKPGGIGFDPDPRQIRELSSRCSKAIADATQAIELLWAEPSVLNRFEETGTITPEVCYDMGLVGPAARACGIEQDVRFDHCSGIYRFAQIPVSTWHTGDVFSRAYVRWLEIQRSADFITNQLEVLSAEDTLVPLAPAAPDKFVAALVEGWRGEICHIAVTDSHGKLEHYKVTDPSFHNWTGLALALRGQQISDFPLCNKSFNLSYCGFDL